MATCEKREIVQPKPPVEYVLTLSEDEARAVYRALQYVPCRAGEAPPVDRVSMALFGAGVRLL